MAKASPVPPGFEHPRYQQIGSLCGDLWDSPAESVHCSVIERLGHAEALDELDCSIIVRDEIDKVNQPQRFVAYVLAIVIVASFGIQYGQHDGRDSGNPMNYIEAELGQFLDCLK